MESDMFMDALSASANPKKDIKKRKRIPSASETISATLNSSKSSKQSKENDVESPKIIKAEPLSFYKDTLDESEDDKKDSDSKSGVKTEKNAESEDGVKEENTEMKDEKDVKDVKEESAEEDEPSEPRPPGPGCGPDGPPGVLMLHRRKGKKKRIQWRPSDELIEIRYFELDETERVNVTKTFSEQRSMDRCDERKLVVMGRKQQCDDLMQEQTTWRFPELVDNVPAFAYGSKSREAKIQADRERTVLQAIYFSRSLVPDSPTEPDLEFHETTDPQVIPLDDLTGNPDAVNNFTDVPWPEPKSDNAVRSQFPTIPNIPFGPPFNAPPAAFKMVPGAPNWGPIVPNPIFNNGMVFQPPPFMGGMPPAGMPMGMPGMPMQNRPPMQRGGWFRGGPPPPNRGPPTRGNWVQNQRNVCKQFQVKGYCRNGNNCNYLHQNF